MRLSEIKLTLANPKASEFMKAFWDMTDENPFGDRERIMDQSVGIECYPFNGNIHFAAIRSFYPSQGKASAALDKFLALADSFGVTVECDAKPFGNKGLNKAKLTAWYKRHGFVPAKSRYGLLIHEPTPSKQTT